MDKYETQQFFTLLDNVSEQCGKPKKSIQSKALMLDTLGHYGFENIKGAIYAHLRDPECGMFDVTIAHIHAQIANAIEKDGRPTADEAFAIAIQLADEAATVVTNDEISQAWAVAAPLMPDKQGARMAFRPTYNRLCDAARRENRKPRWFPSLGFDVAAREPVLQESVRKGLLGPEHVQRVLPAPEQSINIPALENSAAKHNAKETLKALMQLMKQAPLAVKQNDQE